jgi:hypothetical protein
MNKLTTSQIKALNILKGSSYSGKKFRPGGFAFLMWPDSPMHIKVSNTGNGSTKGKGAWLCGGSYLKKLEKLGYVAATGEFLNEWYITPKGKEALEKIN